MNVHKINYIQSQKLYEDKNLHATRTTCSPEKPSLVQFFTIFLFRFDFCCYCVPSSYLSIIFIFHFQQTSNMQWMLYCRKKFCSFSLAFKITVNFVHFVVYCSVNFHVLTTISSNLNTIICRWGVYYTSLYIVV